MPPTRPTKEQAENAVKLLLDYIGEDQTREGLRDTPKRVVKSYNELFSGYGDDVAKILDKKFFDISTYRDIILLRDIDFSSLCEHHMLPFAGRVDIAYIPNGFVLGVSKLARLVDAYAKRLQIQEKMTAEIADSLQDNLNPLGVAIRITATHSCMTSRGSMKGHSMLDSFKYTGEFEKNATLRQEFLRMI